MGFSPAEIDVCAATRRERYDEALDFVRSGGRLLVQREWDAYGLAFGEYSLDHRYRSTLIGMGRGYYETCRAQGCFPVGNDLKFSAEEEGLRGIDPRRDFC